MKELHWLDSMVDNKRWARWDTAAYLSHFEANMATGDRQALEQGRAVLLDATPAYLTQYPAAPRARALMPHAKFVLVLRVRCLRRSCRTCLLYTSPSPRD